MINNCNNFREYEMPTSSDVYKESLGSKYVMLRPLNKLSGQPHKLGNIVFNVRPVITESRNVGYSNEGMPMTASGLVIYAATESRIFNITAKFISRTIEEASDTWNYIQLIKSYSIPEYINNMKGFMTDSISDKRGNEENVANSNASAQDVLDATNIGAGDIFVNPKFNLNQYGPSVLQISGYDTFNDIPCVLQSYNVEYPDDVDYINFPHGNNMRSVPIFQTVSITLIETHLHELLDGSGNISDVSKLFDFNMKDYRNGTLKGY